MNKVKVLKAANTVGYIGASVVGGKLWGSLWAWIWRDFTSDENYAEEHPKMFLFKVLLILVSGAVLSMAIVSWPLKKLYFWIDSKIEGLNKKETKEEDKEWDYAED